jgi:hypothetical protein
MCARKNLKKYIYSRHITKYKEKQKTLTDVHTNKRVRPSHMRVYTNINIIDFQPPKRSIYHNVVILKLKNSVVQKDTNQKVCGKRDWIWKGFGGPRASWIAWQKTHKVCHSLVNAGEMLDSHISTYIIYVHKFIDQLILIGDH